jgi:3-oxoacyl-[acyl-carrier protein] reductase
VAAPEVSDPPELIGPVDGVAKPAGKSDSGSSTDSSWVPVSWPAAAGSEVIETAGAADADAAPAELAAAADGDVAAADDAAADVTAADDAADVAADEAELPAEEQPAMPAMPATPSSAMALRLTAPRRELPPRRTTDDTGLFPLDPGSRHLTKVPALSAGGDALAAGIRNNDPGTPAFACQRRRAEEGNAYVMPQRIAIVTGAARGIGAGTAKRLAADGMFVGVLDLGEADGAQTVAEIEKAGGRAIAVGADVSNAEQVTAAVEKVAADLGEPTVLVNNAGVTRDNLLFKMNEADWDTVMNVHLKGAFLMSRACQQYMVAAKWGRIINLSSLSAVGNRGQVNYSAAKAGLQGFTKTLALELGKFGITANAVAPGFVVTDMTAATAARLGVSFEDFQAGAAKQIPVQRVGQVEDIAHAISFFASEGAGYVSGQILYLSGGPVS